MFCFINMFIFFNFHTFCIVNTFFSFFCNNHFKYTLNEEKLLATIDPDIMKMYKKKTIEELKNELRAHNYKLTGKKEDLINRLIMNLNH